ncbi:histidine kinase [Sphingomonas sp. Root710]|uniref:sensor histidine kinase n=1 Tax=Sphingomonas sp. Root710 TaxID=1736594 RepID=UPI0039DF7530
MTLNHDAPRGSAVSPRVALLSILCFWLVYFAVATIRSLMIDWGHQTEMLAARAFVTTGSMIATYIVYLAMRPLAGRSLAVNVTAVALLAIPAAVAYSSMNWMAFNQLDKQIEAEKAREIENRKYVIDDSSVAQAREQARIAIAAARDAIRQATEQAKAAAAAKAEAQHETAAAAAQRDAERKKVEVDRKKAEAERQAKEAQRDWNQVRTAALREADQARREALREADQARRDAMRDAYQAQREAYYAQREAYREAQQSYKESIEEARQAVEEAKLNGVDIDINEILSSIPAPPAAPTPPAPPNIRIDSTPVPPAPPAAAKPAAKPVPSPASPPAPVRVAPVPPVVIPTPVITEPTPGTVMIQVGQPMSSHKEKELSIAGKIGDQALNGYFFFAAWGALFLALSYAAAVRAAEREAAGYRAAARDAELRALRYQVNPHFLFNTLNSLSTLILKDQKDDAEAMILNLSTFFRTSLTADPTEDVVLSEEIRLQRLYLDIEAVRFPERLIVDINVPAQLSNACVPCLILQPLVENAIKYGVSRAKRPVTIQISAREDSHGLVLSVEDDGEPLGDDAKLHGAGVGLKNVTDRLKARFGDEAACRYGPLPNGGFGVTIFMPLIRNGL